MKSTKDSGIFQLANGTWGYRFKIVLNGKTIDRRKLTDENGNHFRTKTAAIKARKAAILAEENKAPSPGTALKPSERKTIQEIYTEYCEKGRTDKALTTQRKQDSLWNNHLQAAFGNKLVDSISVAEINDYLAKLYYKENRSYGYTESFLKMFYLIFGQAYSRDYLDLNTYNKLCVNPITKIHMPKMKPDEETDIVIFTKEQLQQLDDYFKSSHAETAYLLGKYCGLRINECYGLKWDHVNLEKGTILIDRQMQYQDGLIKLVSAKTKNAKREIYLNAAMRLYLTNLKNERERSCSEHEKVQKQNQTFICDMDGKMISSLELVNCLPNGKIQTNNSMKYHAKMIKERYGFTFKYHYLRHTYGTALAEMNTPAHILCKQMGHGKINTTQQYYLALSPSGIEMLKNNLDKL